MAPRPGTPEWYRDTLLTALSEQRQGIQKTDDYYEGDHNLAFATSKFRQAFGDLFSEFSDNWCGLVVDAVEERLDVDGFRMGGGVDGDQAAWDIWQRNQMDAFSQQGHLESLISGEASALVWWDADSESAKITVEHPEQMVVMYSGANPTERIAALKTWDDINGVRCNLYLPTGIYKWVRESGSTWVPEGFGMSSDDMWTRYSEDGEEWPVPNPLGVVPVVPLVNRPRLLRPPKSEIADVIPVQDAINKLVADMMVASEYQAYRQRWATGLELPTIYDENGDPVPDDQQFSQVWQHAIDRLWYTEDPETKFGEFGATDLRPFVTGIEMLVQHVASQTRTPPHYFYLSGNFPSGESIKSAETGLVAKVYRKQRFYGEAWEEVMRLAFAVEGDTEKAADYKMETIWRDPESRTEAEHVDAVTKKASLGIPVQQVWEDLGYSPSQIERFRTMRQQDVADTSGLALALSQALDGAAVAEE